MVLVAATSVVLVAAAAVVVVEPAVVVVVARVGAGGGWDAWGRPPRHVCYTCALPAGDVYLLTYLLDAVHPCVHLTILNCVG